MALRFSHIFLLQVSLSPANSLLEELLLLEHSKIWITKSGQGLPIVLCNGGPGCDDYLEPISKMLEHKFTVVRFEPRGCGRSDYDGKYQLEQTLADIESIRQHYGFDQFIIGGHSAGPDVALAYTLAHPNRILGLFGIAGGRIVDDREWSKTYHENMSVNGETSGDMKFQSEIDVNQIGNATWKKYIKGKTLLKDIANVQIPVQYIVAGADNRPNWPTEQLASLFPLGKYVSIPDATHMIWLTHSEQLKSHLLDYLEQF